MYRDVYPSFQYYAEYFHCPKNLLCSTYSSLPTTENLATANLFTVSIVLPFPEYHIVSIVQSEKAMATHSSTLAWKIPWMEEPGRLQSMGSLGVRHD